MATISNTPRPGYVWDSTDNVWYPIGVGAHQHTNAADTPAVIPNALVDAKGDLLTATADNTPARLAVGNNGETLVADSSTSTGLRYQAPVNANPIINSAFQIWQRGTSIVPTTSSYTADRWFCYRAVAGSTVSRQATNDTTNLPFIQYCARVQRDSGNTSTTVIGLSTSLETINSIPYAGKTITTSFYLRVGANWSGGNLTVQTTSGTGTDQNVTINYTGAATVGGITFTPTTTWVRYSYTGTVAATATELAFGFNFNPTGTAGAADYYEITGVQLEVGSVATPFKTYAGTLQGELAACQRYYTRTTSALNAFTPMYSHSFGYSSTNAVGIARLPVRMRVKPTAVEYSNVTVAEITSGASLGVATIVIGQGGDDFQELLYTGLSGLTTYRPYANLSNNTTSAFIGLTAEL